MVVSMLVETIVFTLLIVTSLLIAALSYASGVCVGFCSTELRQISITAVGGWNSCAFCMCFTDNLARFTCTLSIELARV